VHAAAAVGEANAQAEGASFSIFAILVSIETHYAFERQLSTGALPVRA